MKKRKEGFFIPFVVLGDPSYDISLKIIKTLIASGADALELGFAFSDPIADGKTIQAADQRALSRKIFTDKCFSLLKKIRSMNNEIPISLLVYYNLIYQRGIENFYRDAKNAGVDAILASDVPAEEAGPLLSAAKKFKINQIFLVTPTTTASRLRKILKHASGYIYLVSVLGVTGARANIQKRALGLIKRVRRNTELPIFVGFGISKPGHIKEVIKEGADGAIVGSAIVKIIESNLGNEKGMLSRIASFTRQMKAATRHN